MTDESPASEPGRPMRMTEHLAAQLKRIREAQRLPLTQLAERLTELGQPIARLGLQRIEKGERKVDVDEVAALAKALGVPPLLLFLPVGAVERVEILPGYVRDTWEAAKWFTGEGPLQTKAVFDSDDALIDFTHSSEDFNAWQRGSRALDLTRTHDRLLMEWRIASMHAMSDLDALRGATSDFPDIAEQKHGRVRLQQLADESISEARERERALLDHRRQMEREGVTLPFVAELEPDRRRDLAEHGLQVPPESSEAGSSGQRYTSSIQLPPLRDPNAPPPGSDLSTPGAQLAAATLLQMAERFNETGKLPGDPDDEADQEGGR